VIYELIGEESKYAGSHLMGFTTKSRVFSRRTGYNGCKLCPFELFFFAERMLKLPLILRPETAGV